MKFYTSYFYNVRFFPVNLIPFSTAIFDPKWFHDFKNQDYFFKDKRGVWNGLRVEEFNPKSCNAGGCPCKIKNPETCWFLKSYKKGLEKINFDKVISDLTKIAYCIKQEDGWLEEPEIVLLVHEAKDNPCSERNSLQELFREHGLNITEWGT